MLTRKRVVTVLVLAIVPLMLCAGALAKNKGKKKDKYVTGRYYCVDKGDGSERGTCDVTTWADSCSTAISGHRDDIRSRGDVCKYCVKGQIDNTRRYNKDMDWIHGGPCRGQP